MNRELVSSAVWYRGGSLFLMARRHLLLLPAAALMVLCTGCGDPVTTPATGPPHVRTPPDVVSGEMVTREGWTVVVVSPDGSDSSFAVTARTPVTAVVTGAADDIQPGTCVAAGGGRAGAGLVAAWVLVDGPAGCARPGAAIAGRLPAGLTPVVGTVRSVAAGDVSVEGPAGAGRFSFTVATPVGRVLEGSLGDLMPGRCVVAHGRRAPTGSLTARHVQIVPTPIGGCFSGGGGVAALASVEPRAGSGSAPSPADLATTATTGNPGVIAGGTVGGGGATPFPGSSRPEGSNLSSAPSAPRPLPSPPPAFVPMPAPAPATPTQRPGGASPAPGPGVRQQQGPSPAPGRRGAVGATPPP